MDQPSSLTLRPATITDLLDRTFRIYRNNFSEILKLMVAVMVPITVLNILLNTQSANLTLGGRSAGSLGTPFGVLIFTLLIGLIQTVLISGTLTCLASEACLGRKVTALEAFQIARTRFVSLALGLIWVFILAFIVTVGIGVIIALCNVGALSLGFFAYVLFGVYALMIPTLTLERTRVVAGINRGTMLTRARFWPVLAVLGAIFTITTIINFALGFAGGIVIVQVIPIRSFATFQAAQIVLQALISIVIAPVLPIGATLAYYDARTRLEGLDIALQAVGTPDARPSDVESPLVSLRLVRSDYINILILTVAGFVLWLLAAAAIRAFFNNFLGMNMSF
jgi:hypothetical protein